METGVNAYVFYWSYIAIIAKQCFTDESVCPRNKSYIMDGKVMSHNKTLCCDNYEMRDGKCKECKLGFYRPVDHTPEKCIACMEDSYGEKCAYACKCSPTERCNSMTGSCVSKPVAKEELTTHFDNAAVSFTSSTSTSSTLSLLMTVLVVRQRLHQKYLSRHYSATRREQQHVQNIQVRNEIVGDLDDESVYNIIE